MKPHLPIIAALSLALTGCNSLNSARDFFADPKTRAAVQTLHEGAEAFVCGFAGQVNLASRIAAAVNAKQAVQTDLHTALVVSTDVCVALGGATRGTAIVPAS